VSVIRDTLIVLMLLVWAAPVGWQIVTSLTPGAELLDARRWWPAALTLEHYRAVLASSPLPRALGNSAGIAVATTLLASALGTLGAYALARLPVPGRRALMVAVVMSTAFPAIATVAPLYLIIRALGLRDTWYAVIIADTSFALPLMLWLVTGFLRELPREMEEAAWVDGASRLEGLRHVVLPAVAPGLAAAALVTFLSAWNEFLFAYTFTATEASRTVPVALALFPGVFEVPWGDIAAAALLASLPPVIVVVALQKYLVRGLLAGSLKE
jgi:ABC-type glycerol-3-phosphate transport system permease component